MNSFISKMTEKAKENPKRIAFPEATNVDILRTAEQVVLTGIGFPVLIGNSCILTKLAMENGIHTDGFTYFDYSDEEVRLNMAEEYIKYFDDFTEKSVLRKSKNPVRFALFLLKLQKVDCVAAGKEYSTGDVVFETMNIIGLQEGIETPSSLGIADVPGFDGLQGQMFGVADCAITVQPDAKDLAGIAIASAETVKSLINWEPRVAMLAFSTHGSAEHESIDVIREAVKIVREKRPDIKIDGELQLDSALIPKVAAKKVPEENEVAGKANVLIFPNLHAGNIGVKLIQIFGRANVYGPILQGFAQPVCDFSRSAPVEEMLGNVAMLVIRAESAKKKQTEVEDYESLCN
jgi:phosphate acetyltransferase